MARDTTTEALSSVARSLMRQSNELQGVAAQIRWLYGKPITSYQLVKLQSLSDTVATAVEMVGAAATQMKPRP